MPDKDNFQEVLQPVAYRWQNDRDGLVSDGTVSALRASAGESGFHEMNHPVVAQPVPFRKAKRAQSATDDETSVPAQQANTLNGFDTGERDTHAVAFTVDMQACKGNANVGDGSVSPTLCKPSGNDVHAVAIGTDCYNGAVTGDVAATMGTPGSNSSGSGPTVMQAVAFKPGQSAAARSIGAQEGVACTLEAGGGGNNKQAVAFNDVAATVKGGSGERGYPDPSDGNGHGIVGTNMTAPTITATNDPSRSPQSAEITQQVAAVHASTMTVRRLTPTECSRLQGFPDDWTLIPWRGKPADQCPDGPRYKALGNSMAVNCMAWIGERIAAVEARHAG